MRQSFIKMHGLGNDFMVLNCLERPFSLNPTQVQQLSDRQTGVGFDQLLVLSPSLHADADFEYRVLNADGSEVGQCGNGARCIGLLLARLGYLTAPVTLHTVTTTLTVERCGELFRVVLPSMRVLPRLQTVDVAGSAWSGVFVDLGNPHIVFQVEEFDEALIREVGSALQQHTDFPTGVNVGFMCSEGDSVARLRVFERGVGLTRACGSGAAAALGAVRRSCNI